MRWNGWDAASLTSVETAIEAQVDVALGRTSIWAPTKAVRVKYPNWSVVVRSLPVRIITFAIGEPAASTSCPNSVNSRSAAQGCLTGRTRCGKQGEGLTTKAAVGRGSGARDGDIGRHGPYIQRAGLNRQ